MSNALPLLALTMGLTSSFHCIGMCGPIALALPIQRTGKFKQILSLLSYNGGRALSYAFFGALLGLMGSALAWVGYLRYFSILAGLLMVGYVVFQKKSDTFLHAPGFWQKSVQSVKRLMAKLLQSGNPFHFLFLGMLNGLLPCGMVYLALISSLATGNMYGGAVYMFVFGLGTLPVMMAVGFFKQLFTPGIRNQMRRATPVIICIAGVWLVARGLMIHYPTNASMNPKEIPVCHGK